MHAREKEILLALDHQVETNPAALQDDEMRLYRRLIIRYVSEMSCEALTDTPPPPTVPS